jgi:hypothetical protein
MKVKIYVNTDEYGPSDLFPLVITEKQYQEKIDELVTERMNNLKDDDGFADSLVIDYSISQVFFMTEDDKAKVLEEFKPYAVDSAKDEMKDYYEEYEIEI